MMTFGYHIIFVFASRFDPSLIHATSLIAIFIASLVGSLHCVGMCGGFVVLAAAGAGGHISLGQVWYHLGRGLGYVALGACVGGIGDVAINYIRRVSFHTPLWVVLLTCALCAWLLWIWVRGSFARTPDSSVIVKIASRPVASTLRRISGAPFLLGLVTPFLPCPWLYSFVTVAAISGEVGRGAAIMCAFWVGTLPALLVVGTVFESSLRSLLKRFPRVSFVALLLAVILSVMLHLARSL